MKEYTIKTTVPVTLIATVVGTSKTDALKRVRAATEELIIPGYSTGRIMEGADSLTLEVGEEALGVKVEFDEEVPCDPFTIGGQTVEPR